MNAADDQDRDQELEESRESSVPSMRDIGPLIHKRNRPPPPPRGDLRCILIWNSRNLSSCYLTAARPLTVHRGLMFLMY